MSPKLEIACFNEQSALIAAKAGADRIELCDNVHEGGTTPDIEVFIRLKKTITIPIYVMIRLRGGNFLYSENEFEEMKHQITLFKTAKADGFVFGVLDQHNRIDIRLNTELVKLASPLPCSFHRAFDHTPNAAAALEEVIQCGFKTILTSGSKSNAMKGIDQLTELVKLAKNRIVIMPGGGLRSSNIAELKDKTKAIYFHSSAIIDKGMAANFDEILELKKQSLV